MDEKQIYNQISLKAARTDKGYTQEALALKLGIAPKPFQNGKTTKFQSSHCTYTQLPMF